MTGIVLCAIIGKVIEAEVATSHLLVEISWVLYQSFLVEVALCRLYFVLCGAAVMTPFVNICREVYFHS